MRYVMFTKFLKRQSVPELISTLKKIGMDGADMAVRPGYPVNQDNVRKSLPEAAKQFRDAGLAIPLISVPTDFIDPTSRFAEDLWAACHDAQIPQVKIGYWPYKADYWKLMDNARKALDGFHNLSQRFGVKAAIHTHSGDLLPVNASALMDLLKGRSASSFAAYLDPGHLNLNGEPLPMAFDMASEYLSLIAVKDSLAFKPNDGKTARGAHFVPLGEGTVDWHTMMRVLVARKFDGTLSLHSEYENLAEDKLIEQTAKDLAFLKAVEKNVSVR